MLQSKCNTSASTFQHLPTSPHSAPFAKEIILASYDYEARCVTSLATMPIPKGIIYQYEQLCAEAAAHFAAHPGETEYRVPIIHNSTFPDIYPYADETVVLNLGPGLTAIVPCATDPAWKKMARRSLRAFFLDPDAPRRVELVAALLDGRRVDREAFVNATGRDLASLDHRGLEAFNDSWREWRAATLALFIEAQAAKEVK